MSLRQLADRHKACGQELADQQVVCRTLDGQLVQLDEETAAAAGGAGGGRRAAAEPGCSGARMPQRQLAELEDSAGRAGSGRQAGRGPHRRGRAATARRRSDWPRPPASNAPRASSGWTACACNCDSSKRTSKNGPGPWPTPQRQLASAADRRRGAVQSMLQATSELAVLYLDKDALATEIVQHTAQHSRTGRPAGPARRTTQDQAARPRAGARQAAPGGTGGGRSAP